jgi:hypothetical protein
MCHVLYIKTEGTERRGRRRRHLLIYLKETSRYCELKAEALDRILGKRLWTDLKTDPLMKVYT